MKLPTLSLLCLLLPFAVAAEMLPYAVTTTPLPVYNSRAAAANGSPPQPDQCGQVRQLEFIALPATLFRVVAETGTGRQTILEVTTDAYRTPAGIRLYIHDTGLTRHVAPAPSRKPPPPQPTEVLNRLLSARGLPYVWGGNLRQGLQTNANETMYAGLDCSGLLYDATDGFTPRNTADLVNYGQPVPISGLSLDQLVKRLKPLDLIVWKGHVVIVADGGQAIESVLLCGQPGNGGVQLTPLRQRLKEIMTRRRAVDSWPEGSDKQRQFVIRRWLP